MSSSSTQQWFAACPRGLEGLLAGELVDLGALSTRETVAGAYFEGPLAVGYRACLWSRLANRILLPVLTCEAPDADTLYRELSQVNWDSYFSVEQSFAIDFSGQNDEIRNTLFGAQKSKDAIVDWFVAKTGKRPDIEKRNPDIRLNIRLSKDRLIVGIDFSGGSLHRRGYRLRAGDAPLKENLAAAVLLRADWPGIAERGGALIDPMCGSGTLLLEGAMMVADIAPGLWRERFGFESWKGHNPDQWHAILQDAKSRAERGRAGPLPEIRGYDADPKVIRYAQENIARIDMQKLVRVTARPLSELSKPSHMPLPMGLVVCNPPYGERLGEKESLRYLYRELGEAILREFPNWHAAIFTSDIDLGKATGLRSHKRYALWNGALASSLLLFNLAGNEIRDGSAGKSAGDSNDSNNNVELSEGSLMFANRIRKNRKRLSRWVKRESISCYRLYDADMPEYAVAVDVYGDQLHVAEYQAPKGIDPEAAARRLQEVVDALPQATGVPQSAISYKQRQRQRGTSQYEKADSREELITVNEGEVRLLVNLYDYLDTGLFLDHRPLRLRIAAEVEGKDFLNLFCYTGAATIHAAMGGASTTCSVDMSHTYLAWMRKNLAVNGLDEKRNSVIQGNCLTWLEECTTKYDLVLLDPPSFSNSRRMEESFDVQRDHAQLIHSAMKVLRKDGLLYFSNNRRGFRLEEALGEQFECVDITGDTLDPDFQRNANIHKCWAIRHRQS
ncbi:MAG: bifunctional 23S rRNA (guanine(2069)-N(7))-methyltransferase RlmK/23S rRNA (guanine(2445)-N(2))-methyltransferase RlmL [Halioglobus sp.]